MADEKATYQVLSPLKHNGKLYTPADGKVVKVSLTEDEARELKALNIVGDMPAKADKKDNQGDQK